MTSVGWHTKKLHPVVVSQAHQHDQTKLSTYWIHALKKREKRSSIYRFGDEKGNIKNDILQPISCPKSQNRRSPGHAFPRVGCDLKCKWCE